MRRLCVGLLAVCALSAAVAAQDRCGLKYDQSVRVTAYQLSPEQEAMFQTADGNQISPFWYAWDEVATMDKATLSCVEHYAYGPEDCRTSTSDAQLTLKVAYGDKGVYLYFTVLDDNFMAMPPGQEGWGHFYDVVELFIDKYSASDLYADPSKFLDPTISQLTISARQFQIPFGAVGENPVAFDFVMPYAPMDDWRTGPLDWMFRMDDIAFTDAATNYCIHVDVVNGVAGCRKQEWLIPWGMWGGGYNNGTLEEGFGTKPAEGAALAMTFGYNDLDPSAVGSAMPSALRWRNQKDPWLTNAGECATPGQSVDAWGEIVFGASLSSVLTNAGKADLTDATISTYYTAARVTADEDANQTYDRDPSKVPVCTAPAPVDPESSLRRSLKMGMGAFSAARSEFYSITGRKLSGVRAVRGNLMVRRDLDATGKAVTSKLITAR